MNDLIANFMGSEVINNINVSLLESECLKLDQVECNVIHRFSNGLYIREVHLKAGIFAIGHHQNFDHLNIFLKGRVTIVKEDKSTDELIAPMIFTGKPGRKMGFIHEDVVWLNIYPTNETDIDKLESIFITKSDEFLNHLNSEESIIDISDYIKFLSEIGLTDSDVKKVAYNEKDMTDLPYGDYKFKVGASRIEGKGILATCEIKENEIIGPARIGGLRTVLGRYTNHSHSPNAEFIRQGSNISLAATKNINGCRGGMDGEEITVDYRKALKLTLEINKEVICPV